jgi:hypothetical protein
MSRTYRKSSITEQESLVKYINDHINVVKKRRRWEYYMTEGGRKAYEKAMEEWETAYGHWLYGRPCTSWFPPSQPTEYEFKNVRITYVEYDHDEEVKYATEEYKKFKRDGRFYDGDLNRSYKKHCASDLRRLNRELARKIIKDDDSWEQKPYPDTYLGKQYVWDYW